MSAKYTPGPWRVEYYNRDINVQYQPSKIVGVNGEHIIQFDSANHDANARLIAEAPAMVELARAFVSYLEDDSRSERRRQTCLSEARAILARIEGSQ